MVANRTKAYLAVTRILRETADPKLRWDDRLVIICTISGAAGATIGAATGTTVGTFCYGPRSEGTTERAFDRAWKGFRCMVGGAFYGGIFGGLAPLVLPVAAPFLALGYAAEMIARKNK